MVFSVGCNKKESNTKTKKLNICFNMDPKTLDARKSGDLVSSATLLLLFSGLTEATPSGEIVPALAESYEISDDQKCYVFHIRKDAKWSDGHEITAHDFEKSWKKVIDPNFPSLCRQVFYPIKNAEKAAKGEVSLDEVGINALDDHTLVVNLHSPIPYFLSLTSFCLYFPVPAHIAEKDPNWECAQGDKFVCSGPFKLKKWNHTSDILLQKNPNHFNATSIYLDEIYINIVNDENTTLQMYQNNQIDWAGALISPLPLDSLPSLKKSKEFLETPIGGTTFCTFNVKRFPFNNKNIRKAFGLAIDRKSIVKNIIQGDAVATRCIPPILMKNKEISYYKDNDTEKAKDLLNQGLRELKINKDDLKITFSYGSNILHKKQAEALVEHWKEVFGIPITLEQVEEKLMLDRLHKHQYQTALTYLVIQYRDPMNIFDRFKSEGHCKNYPEWENSVYINLLNYSTTFQDMALREQILEKAEEIFLDEMPISPIYHHNYKMMTKPYVRGLFVGPVGEMRFDKVYFIK